MQHAKRKGSSVLLTDSEDDFVEMGAKTKISNADHLNHKEIIFSLIQRG